MHAPSETTRARSFAIAAPALALTLVLAGLFAGRAAAADQFTLDHKADSMGPIAVDQSGNGYVAWLHASGSTDIDMFCKLSPGASKCARPVTLSVSLPAPASTNTPFPILGPWDQVFVVAPSYDSGQMVIWKSTDGGGTFTTYVGPTNTILGESLEWTNTCNVAVNLDDVLPFNAYGGQYDRSQGTTTLGSSAIEFEMSSADPDRCGASISMALRTLCRARTP